MSIIISILVVLFITCVIGYICSVVSCKVAKYRDDKAFANLPKKVLFNYAYMSPVYRSQYDYMRQVMTDERAADFAIKRMLTDMGIIAYRKNEA